MKSLTSFITTHTRALVALAAGGVGVIAYIVLYGPAVIDVTNTSWLLAGGDLSQHYLGWEFYRQSPWGFPLGGIEHLAYPNPMSVVYLDTIPVLAIIFKVFASWLPETFQYFGIWGALVFFLQPCVAALILSRFTTKKVVIIAGALVALLMPVMLNRMFAHAALSGQFVILLALLAAVWLKRSDGLRPVLAWSAVVVLATLIHPYFVVMVAAVLASWVVYHHQHALWSLACLLAPLLAGAGAFWLIGGFMVSTVSADDLGAYAYSIGSMLNPAGWSSFLPATYPGTFESASYIGLGGVVLLGLAIATVVRRKYYRRVTRRMVVAALPLLGLLVLALSPSLVVFSHVVFTVPLPDAVEKVWSIFRATARLAWPLVYIAIIAALVVLIRAYPRRGVVSVMVVVALALQIGDVGLSPRFRDSTIAVGERAASSPQRSISSPWAEELVDKRHVVYIGTLHDPRDFAEVGQLALSRNLTLNTGYFARAPGAVIDATIKQHVADLKAGIVRADTLYITRDRQLVDDIAGVNTRLNVSSISGYYVLK